MGGTMVISRYYTTRRAAMAWARTGTHDGVFVIEGKGNHLHPWAVLDAGTAEDALADDIGREEARTMLRRLSDANRYVVTWGMYQRT
jgi:hypothetical protein